MKLAPSFEAEIEAQEMGRVPQSFQRPQMEMPTPGRQAAASQDFWGSFSEMMDSSPENAWRYLSQAPQGALQAKALIQDDFDKHRGLLLVAPYNSNNETIYSNATTDSSIRY